MLPPSFTRFTFTFLLIFVLQDLVNLFHSSFNGLVFDSSSDTRVVPSQRINFLSSLMVNAFCPSACRCDNTKLKALCSNASLSIVPITLNPNMRKILLNFNQIVKLSTDSFSVYRNIEFLDLSYNKMDTLEDNSFRGLTKLKTLHLDGNKLISLNNNTFNGLSGLEELYLSDNLLSNLNESVFRGLTHLKQLNLNSNRLNHLGSRSFVGLNSLRTLHLNDNLFHLTMESTVDSSISGNDGESGISSTSNQPQSLLDGLSPVYLPNLIKLSLDGNNLSFISKSNSPFFSGINSNHPFASSSPSPDSSQNQFGSGENHNSHYSHARSKRREPIEDSSSAKKINLKIWNLQELSLEGCSINSIESHSFNGLPKLTTLRLHRNNFQQVPKDIFTDLSNLEVLQIGGNPFTTINSTSFTTLTSLKSLEISRCPHLNAIESGSMIGLTKLEQLEISLNPNLNYIEPTLFDPLVSLKSLILSYNSFTFLDSHISLIANRIKLFDVRGNPFTCTCAVQWIRKLFLKNGNDTNSNSEVLIKGLLSSSSSSTSLTSSLTSSTTENSVKGVNEEGKNGLDSSVKREKGSQLFLPSAARRIAPSSSSSSTVFQSGEPSKPPSSHLNELSRVTCATPLPLKGKQIIDLEPGDMGCYEVESMAPIVIGVLIGCLLLTGVIIICGIRWRGRLTGLIKGSSVSKNRSHMDHHYPAKINASTLVNGVGCSSRKIFGLTSHNPIRANDLDYGPYSKPECIIIPSYGLESTTIINNLNNPYEVVPLSGSLLRIGAANHLGDHHHHSHPPPHHLQQHPGYPSYVDRIRWTVNGINGGVNDSAVDGGVGCGSGSSSLSEGEYHYPIVSNLRSTPITEL